MLNIAPPIASRMKKSRLSGHRPMGEDGEAKSIHGKAEERIAKVYGTKYRGTSSDNNREEPGRADVQPLCERKTTRPRQAHHKHHQSNKQDPQETRKCRKGMMTMLQAFKLTLSCQNNRTDH